METITTATEYLLLYWAWDIPKTTPMLSKFSSRISKRLESWLKT